MLLEDWKAILLKAWSVRFIVLSAMLSGFEAALPVMQAALEPLSIIPPGAFAILSALVSAAAVIARILAQPDGTK